MSAPAIKWAVSQDLPQTEKAVLIALARAYSPRWGHSKPTQKKVADEVGVTRETVNRKLLSLAKRGLISIGTEPRKGGQWDRRFYMLAPLQGGIKTRTKRAHRVTQNHTAPCDSHQTRHRVTEDHTSKETKNRSAKQSAIVVFPFLKSGGGYV